MQPPMDSYMAIGPRMPQGLKQPPEMPTVNGSRPGPVMHPGQRVAPNTMGYAAYGDSAQLSDQLGSMHMNANSGPMPPRVPNPSMSQPPVPPHFPPGYQGSQPSMGNFSPHGHSINTLSGGFGQPIMATSTNGGPTNAPQPFNTGHLPPSAQPPFGPTSMNRGNSPPFAPSMGPTPPMSNANMGGPLQPPMPTGNIGSALPPSSVGHPGGNIAPPLGPPNSMGLPSGVSPVSSSAMGLPPSQPQMSSNSIAPPMMPPFSGSGAMAPHSQPPMPPQNRYSHGGPPAGVSPLPTPPGQAMMPPPAVPGLTQPNAGMTQTTPNYVNAPGGMPNPYPGPPSGGMTQQPQARRLDPDHMPSVIQVTENDRQLRSGVFSTAQRGVTPPLVTTEFVVQDHGNANPRFIRSTLYNVPANSDLLKQMAVPFVLNIAPFAKLHEKENPVPISDLGPQGPVRCNRCKAYMSPFMTFIDGGRRFQCALCGGCTDVPAEYFAHLDHTGRRVDIASRPELWAGSYEIIATKEYCKGNQLPGPPAFVFLLDVSYNSVKSGLTQLFCHRLKTDILPNITRERYPDGSECEPRVGFVTYDKDVHFYNLNPCLSQPQMQVVCDIDEVFVPLVNGFLVTPSEADTLVDSLIEMIPQQFSETRRTETVLGPAIQAGMEALKAANCSGKLFVFHTSLPIAEAPGKLKNRDDRKLLGTEKEKTILTPSTQYYTKLGEECVAAGCSVDLFVFPNSYIDLATISEVPRLTGGNLYKYTYFQADLHAEQFISDLCQAVSAPVAFDSVMRVRTSAGTRPVDFYGHLYMSNTTDVECATFDSDKSISVEIKHDDKLTDGDLVYIQAAILYTSLGGQRRLRIHNLALSVTTNLQELFRAAELDTLVNFISKHSLRMALSKTPKDVRESIANQCASILTCYRKNCAQNSNIGQLILPEGMKLLPLYCNCVIKNDALQGGPVLAFMPNIHVNTAIASDISTDDRSYLMFLMGSMNVKQSQNFMYPRLIPMHNLDPDSDTMPQSVRASVDRLQADGVYLLENGFHMFLWIGQNVNPDFLQSVFGVQSATQIDVEKSLLLDFDNPNSHRVRQIISQIRSERSRHLRLTFIRQHDKLEQWFKHFMVEDRGENGSASYVDFLCHIHKEIRTLMS